MFLVSIYVMVSKIVYVKNLMMHRRVTVKNISAKEFDEKFDKGEDISEYLDYDNALRLKDLKKHKKKTKSDSDTKKIRVKNS